MSTPLESLTPEELHRHASWLRVLARRLVGGAGEAEDLAQDVWVELARGSGPVAHLRAFTARIARRLAARRARARAARERREARAARPEALPGPQELEEHLETQRRLFQELDALPQVHRRVLLLCFHEDLSAAEIARRSGVPESTVRSQIRRALEELRRRLDRRHGGERGAWVVLLARLPEHGVGPGSLALGGGSLLLLGQAALVAGLAGALFLAWPGRGREETPLVRAPEQAPVPSLAAGVPAPGAPGRPASQRSAPEHEAEHELEPTAPRSGHQESDVPLLVQDVESGEALADFLVELARPDGAELALTTDAQGRARLPGTWLDRPFRLTARGDEEWEEPGLERDLTPADRPASGETLVLACATGPTYTLRFDAPPPSGVELVACLARGARPPSEPRHLARLHRDGARLWTRFGPDYSVRSPKGDEPWTLVVLARDGLWRATGTVTTIRGVQAEPVWLASEACAVLRVRLVSDGGPVVGECGATLERIEDGVVAQRWHYFGLAQGGQTTVAGTLQGRGTGVRSLSFENLAPGAYRLSAGSAAHEWARRELTLAGGAEVDVTLDVPRRPGLAELRVVITSETGALPLPPIDVRAREVESGELRSSRYSPRSTLQRRELTIEAPAGVQLELTLEGLESLGTLAWSPGTTLLVRPGDEVVFTARDAGQAPVRRAGVVVRSLEGTPLREVGVTTYFDAEASFLHQTDAEGRVQLEPIQEGASFDLVVLGDGYRPERLRGLVLTRDGQAFEVRLAPGWGAWLDVVLGGDRSAPRPRRAEGARVLVDGIEAGRTDEHGQVLLIGTSAPRTIEVLFPGHRMTQGSIDPVTHEPGAHANGPYWVVLEPVPQ